MSTPSGTGKKIALGLFGILMVGIASAVSIWMGFTLNTLAYVLALSSPQAPIPQVNGVVVSSAVEEVSLGRERTAWQPVVTYDYIVDGTPYTSTVWRTNPPSFQQRAEAERIAGTYAPGQDVVVHYHPEYPRGATLERGYRTWDVYVTVIALLLVAPLCVVLGPASIERRMRKGQQRQMIDALLQRQPESPRTVSAVAFIPAFYNPWVHLPSAVVVVVSMWAAFHPLLIAPDAWLYIGIGALSAVIVTAGPLYQFGALLWTLRHGRISDAVITAYTLHRNRYGRYAYVTWNVEGASGPFSGRFTIPYAKEWPYREGSRVRVLIHPNRPKVLRLIE